VDIADTEQEASSRENGKLEIVIVYKTFLGKETTSPVCIFVQACVKFREMSEKQDSITLTTSAENRFGYSAQFFYGILLAIAGSSLQALGLCLWKLHSTGRHSQRILEESANTYAHNGRELLLHEDLCNEHVDDSVSRGE